MITETAYAKINLHLQITKKRSDGYHEVESVMQAISLFDTITFEKAERTILTCSDPYLSVGEDNLVMKAARAFFEKAALASGCAMHLDKKIPSQAGLGGGSSDAAATLRGLNRLFENPLSEEDLHEIAARLGADVPFCLDTRTKEARGIGTELVPCPSMPPCLLLVCMGKGDKMSTKEAYAALDRGESSPQGMENMQTALKRGDLSLICAALFNRFTALNPMAQQGMEILSDLGAKGTILCGSGAAFLGIFAPEEEERRAKAARAMERAGFITWDAEPIR